MDIFVALVDPIRRTFLELTAGVEELSATTIYEHFPVSPQAVSQRLKVLRKTLKIHADFTLFTIMNKLQKALHYERYIITPECNPLYKRANSTRITEEPISSWKHPCHCPINAVS